MMTKTPSHREERGHFCPPRQSSSRLRRLKERSGQECLHSLQYRRPRTSFEQGTGYDPELLARRAVWELRGIVRHPRYDHAMDTLIELVSARAERVWAAQPYWRKRWQLCRRAGDSAPLMLFFRHWTHAAAVREGIPHDLISMETHQATQTLRAKANRNKES